MYLFLRELLVLSVVMGLQLEEFQLSTHVEASQLTIIEEQRLTAILEITGHNKLTFWTCNQK